MISPDIVFETSLITSLSNIRDEYNQVQDKSKSFLAHILEGINYKNFDFYQEGVELILRDKTHMKSIEVELGYSAARAQLPTIHIILVDENETNQGIGQNEGYSDNDASMEEQDGYYPIFTTSYQATYQLFFSGENRTQCLLLHMIVKSMLVALIHYFEQVGIQNLTTRSGDIMLDQQLTPELIYHRALNLSFTYEADVRSLTLREGLTKNTKILTKNVAIQ